MRKKPTNKKNKTRKTFDLDKNILTIIKDNKTYDFAMSSLPSRCFMKLSMMGAASFLISSKDIKDMELKWKSITDGSFAQEKPKRYPVNVMAYALMNDIPESDAAEKWGSLSKDERKQESSKNDFKYYLYLIKAEMLDRDV